MARRVLAVLAILGMGALGCVGMIDTGEGGTGAPGSPGGPRAAGTPGGPGSPGAPGDPAAPGAATPSAPGSPVPGVRAQCTGGQDAAASRFVRLTNAQYQNTVRDLLFLEPAPALYLPADVTDTGFDTSSQRLTGDEAHVRTYQGLAEELAQKAVSSPTSLSRLVRCDGRADPTGCARTFVSDFGRRAFRRPLASGEVDTYAKLAGRGGALFPSGDAFANGVTLVIQAMLQSPDFLYRVESGADPDGDGVGELTDWEMASRLSYLLWNTMPDEALFAAATAGKLRAPADVRAQAERMVGDARTKSVIVNFHRQWLETDEIMDLTRNAKVFPAYTAGFETALRSEFDRFIEYAAVEKGEGLNTLLTAPYSFINATLAKIYGSTGTFTNTMARTELDANRRAGVLTQAGFLASRAKFDTTDPIARGALILRRVMCTELPPPPPDADQTLPPFSATVRTTRERLEAVTSPPNCRGCHQIINPVGFAFEHYDGVGAWRDTERGAPIDTRGTIISDGERVTVDGALPLIKTIAASHAARGCYARYWVTYAYGRAASEADQCTAEGLRDAMATPGFSVKNALVALTQSRSFLNHIVGRPTP